MKKNKNAFTLIELLAVIAILTIIMVISVPQLITSIKNKKTDALEKTKDLLTSAARNYVIDYELKVPTSISIETLCKNDYLECPIKNPIDNSNLNGYVNVDDNKVYVYSDTRDYITIRDYIIDLYNDESLRTSNGLKKDNTVDTNIRYYGSDPNNYVSFNNELWRIIGIFGNNVKLVRSEKLGDLSWDSSESSVNGGHGVNEWSQSDLKNYLNTMYYGGTEVTCYGGSNNTTAICPTNKLDDASKTLIDNHLWNTGAIDETDTTIVNQETFALNTVPFYNAERGNVTGKICNGGGRCNDTVERATTWTGYIGLPYATDYAYASSESICETNMQKQDSSNAYICKNNNWMFKPNTWYWTMSPRARASDASLVWIVRVDGLTGDSPASFANAVFPAIYLKSNVLIERGTGSETNPYTLSIK